MKTWILVADASRARIFEAGSTSDETRELASFVHPASRQKTSELVTDQPGRTSKGGSNHAHSAMEAHTSAHEVEANHFAALLAKELHRGLDAREFGHLIIVAPPHFLGALRASVAKGVLNVVVQTIDKDLTHASPKELAEIVHRIVPASAFAK